MISQQTIQAVLDAARIEEVIGDFLTLKRRGANHIANCPFHSERSPSFYVSPAKGIYKCFGCGAVGNALKFVMEHEKMTYPDAIKYVAQKYNIPVEETQSTQQHKDEQQHADALYIANSFAAEHFTHNLLETEEGKNIGMSYLQERGFSNAIIQKFGLGYSLDDGQVLVQEARNKGYNLSLLREIGLTAERGGRETCFFRARIMFPLHNTSGKIVAFAGRTLTQDKKIPKYVNSPESPIYHKSLNLYGLHLARTEIRRKNECILVEGYADVISMVQTGIEHVVASSGTSLTIEQIKLIGRFTENVVMLYDGDAAGINAALRGMEMLIEQGLNVRIVALPPKEDPDSYVRKVGKNGMESYIKENGKDFVLFKTDLHLQEIGDDPIKRAELIKEIVHTIAKVQDPLKRYEYVRQCSKRLNISEDIIIAETNKIKWKEAQKGKTDKKNNNNDPNTEPTNFNEGEQDADLTSRSLTNLLTTDRRTIVERDLIRMLLEYGKHHIDQDTPLAAYLVFQLSYLPPQNVAHLRIIEEYTQSLSNGDLLDSDYFISNSDEILSSAAADLLSTRYELSPNWEKMHGIFITPLITRFGEYVELSLNSYKRNRIEALIFEKQTEMQHLNAANQEEQLMSLLREIKSLKDLHGILSKATRTDIVF